MNRAIAAVTFALLLVGVLSPLAATSSPVVATMTTQPKEGPAAPSGGDPVDSFTIIVSSLGFNGSAGNLTMTVNQGDTVKITFIYGDDCPPTLQLPGCDNLPFDNPHQLEVEGYQVKSAVIDTANNESTIKFIAGTTGTFQVHCIIPCEGMDNMQNGWLVVVVPGSTSSSSTSSSSTTSTSTTASSSTTTSSTSSSSTASSTTSSSTATASTSTTTSTTSSSSTTSTSTTSSGSTTTATSTSTTTSVSTTAKKITTATALEAPTLNVANGGLNISVILVTSGGKPVAGVPIVFTAQTDFGNSTLGTNFTGASGWAYLAYPTVPSGWTGVFASFAGGGGYNASSTAFEITALPAPPAPNSASPYVSLQVYQPDLRLIGVPQAEANVIVGFVFLVLACLYIVIFAVIGQGIRGHWG